MGLRYDPLLGPVVIKEVKAFIALIMVGSLILTLNSLVKRIAED
jgi:hypothetical protein